MMCVTESNSQSCQILQVARLFEMFKTTKCINLCTERDLLPQISLEERYKNVRCYIVSLMLGLMGLAANAHQPVWNVNSECIATKLKFE